MKNLLIAAFFMIKISSFAQTEYAAVYITDSIIAKGVALHDKEKYTEAVAEYDKVSPLDPKYLKAQYEKALSLTNLEDKETAKKTMELLYQNGKFPLYPSFYILYGAHLSDLNEFEASEKIFEEGKKYLSNSSNFLFNYALLQVRKEAPQKAIDLLKETITIDPGAATAHYLLGLYAFEAGKPAEGTMALMSYLAIAPTGSYAEKAILQLNARFGSNYLEKKPFVFANSGDDFAEINLVLRNELALNKKYNLKATIDDAITRQVQAVAEYCTEHKVSNGFFETTYVPWINQMVKNNQLEGFMYYMLLSMESKLGKKLTSQKKKILDFNTNYIDKDFWFEFGKRKRLHYGENKEVLISLQNRKPYLIGASVESKSIGKHQYLDENGNLKGDLNFDNDLLEGFQKYYRENGTILSEKIFSKGKLNGSLKNYAPNGEVILTENYKDDILDGISTSYFANGGKRCEATFANGEREGQFTCYHENGKIKKSGIYKKGKLNGNYFEYNELGEVVEESDYKEDNIATYYKTYYNNKVLKSEDLYKDGVQIGSSKKWHTNGNLKKEYFYENGKVIKSIGYAPNKIKESEGFFDSKEKLEKYVYFDGDGKVYFEEIYKGGKIKSTLQYVKNVAKPISSNVVKNQFLLKDTNGILLASGYFEASEKAKNWKYFFNSGVLKAEEFYKNGKENGLNKLYNKNGTIHVVQNMENDTRNGVYESYDNGQLISVYNYLNGKLNGPFKNLYLDGTLKNEGFYENNELVGQYSTYWMNGKLQRVSTYFEDEEISAKTFNDKGEKENEIEFTKKTGKFTTYHYNKTVTKETNFINGLLNGKFIEKDKNNKIIVDCNYVNGQLQGAYKYYSPYETLYMETNYNLGNREGTSKNYDLIGNIRLEYVSVDGESNGATTSYYHNKAKLSDYNEISNSENGERNYYNQQGEKILSIGYVNDDAIYFSARNATGNWEDKTTINAGKATIISYYDNGKKAITMSLLNNEKDGEFIIYSKEGKISYKSNSVNQLLDGERIEYYPNGNIYKKENFVKNNFEGIQAYFDEAGKPIISSEFKNDELHGKTLIYKAGKLFTTKRYNANELVEISN